MATAEVVEVRNPATLLAQQLDKAPVFGISRPMAADVFAVVPKRSASSGSKAAKSDGALSKEEKHDFCKHFLSPVCTNIVSLEMKVCPQYVASLKKDPVTGKRPRPCRDGILCKKLHCREEPSERERVACEQKYNMPFVSAYRLSTAPGDCRLFVRPPWNDAFRVYEKLALHEESEAPRVLSSEHVSIQHEAYIKLAMKNMHQPSVQALQNDEAAGVNVEVQGKERKEEKWRNASTRQLQERYMLHGTDLVAFEEIFKNRCLKAGKAGRSTPKGVYGVLAPADGEEFFAGAGADVNAVIICFEMHGCPLNLSQYSFWRNAIPEGVMGYVRRKKATATGGKSDTWVGVGHEAGCVVRHMYVKQKLLHQFLDEQLESCGYTKKYHDLIEWCDRRLREKYAGKESRDCRSNKTSSDRERRSQHIEEPQPKRNKQDLHYHC